MSYLYQKGQKEPFRLSRSKIDLFLKCPRCFYLDRVLGIAAPPWPGFSLNIAVDELLKKEFDIHRAKGNPHPLMKAYGIDAVPLAHEKMDEWRDAWRRGAQYRHLPTNLTITGGVDDIWSMKNGDMAIVDYKATSTEKEITLDDEYKESYKKQAEIYQWIFRQLGFKVSDTAYFVFCNGLKDKEAFDGKLEFDLSIIEYRGNTAWVEPTIFAIKKILEAGAAPAAAADCPYCRYIRQAASIK